MRVHRNLVLVHRFQQSGLSLRCGAIDFVGQQDIGENRAAFEFKLLLDGRVDRNSQHIGRQHVAGELHPLEAAIESTSQCLTQSRFAHARDAFDQQMSPRHHGYQSEPYDVVFAANHLAQRGFQFDRPLRNRKHGFGGHCTNFTMHSDVILLGWDDGWVRKSWRQSVSRTIRSGDLQKYLARV